VQQPPTATQLGAAIRQLRRSKTELSSEALAAEAGIHRTTLSLIERGHGNPTWEMLRSLAIVLRVEIDEMARLAAEMPLEPPGDDADETASSDGPIET
jgi:DNA-binding XRE family transcriptional regulator